MKNHSEYLQKNNPVITHIADIHFGNTRVSTQDTIDQLNKYTLPKILVSDILFIAGDVFDMSLSLNSVEANLIIGFFIDLFKLAEKNNFIIRVLRGTLSHDRNQLTVLNTIYFRNNFSFDFKYIDKIYFEYMDKWDLNLIYLPDNLGFKSSEDVISYVKKEKDLMGWKKVDYVIGHGSFIHSYPENTKLHGVVYTEDQFDFVKKYVLMGHVHIASKKGKIIFAGSFNRLRHGEESPKGFFFYNDKINFIKNPDATIFKTLYIKQKDDKIIDTIKSFLNANFDKVNKSYLRIVDSPSEVKMAIRNYINKEYPNVIITFKKLKSTKIKYEEIVINKKSKLIQPTYENLHMLLHDVVKRNNLSSTLTKERIGELIEFRDRL